MKAKLVKINEDTVPTQSSWTPPPPVLPVFLVWRGLMGAFFCSHSTIFLVREFPILFWGNWLNPHATDFFLNFLITGSHGESLVINYLNGRLSAVYSYGQKTFYFMSYLPNAVTCKLHFWINIKLRKLCAFI